jgi:hypothetical protein
MFAWYTENEARIRQEYKTQCDRKEEERNEEKAKREATRADFEKIYGPEWQDKLRAQLRDQWDEFVDSCVDWNRREFVTAHHIEMGDQWPAPRDTPTFWYSESFYAAKFWRVFVETENLVSNRAMKRTPDMMDATLFRDTAYADALVTGDENGAAYRRTARHKGAAVRVPRRPAHLGPAVSRRDQARHFARSQPFTQNLAGRTAGSAFPKAIVQTCTVHMIRASLRYVTPGHAGHRD